MRFLLPLATSLLAGCAAPAPVFVGAGPTPLHPAAGDVPGWVVVRADAGDLTCPDGLPASLWVARPDPAPADGPVAVVFHPGAYDWVAGAPSTEPLAGTHYADPSRLSAGQASREVFSVLGQWPSADPLIDAKGALAVALAEQGVTLVLPANCWGDLWHDAVSADTSTGRENDVATDGFERNGFAIAQLAWQAATDPSTASTLGLDLPSTGAHYLVGQGSGGRAVSELLHDGAEPDGAALDATPDDLRAYVDGDPTLYGHLVAGLPRVFPGGTATVDDGALWTAPLPATLVYAWSSRDPEVPAAANGPALDHLAGAQGAVVQQTGAIDHVATAGSLDAARALVAALLGSTPTGARRVRGRVDGQPIGQ